MVRAILVAMSIAAGAGTVSASQPSNPCDAQIRADVASRFEQKITRIEFSYIQSKGGRGGGSKSTALVYVEGCSGYHVYDVFATEYDCESRAHYGDTPNYVRYRTSGGGC